MGISLERPNRRAPIESEADMTPSEHLQKDWALKVQAVRQRQAKLMMLSWCMGCISGLLVASVIIYLKGAL